MKTNKLKSYVIVAAVAATILLGITLAFTAIPLSSAQPESAHSSIEKTDGAATADKEFFVFTTEIEGVDEEELGVEGDAFTLQTIVVNKGDTVTVHFFNLEEEQDERHSFTIASPYNIDEDLAGGESSDVTFTADSQGVFQYYCKYHQPAMRGQLVVLQHPTTP